MYCKKINRVLNKSDSGWYYRFHGKFWWLSNIEECVDSQQRDLQSLINYHHNVGLSPLTYFYRMIHLFSENKEQYFMYKTLVTERNRFSPRLA